jgi:hypothetical protein
MLPVEMVVWANIATDRNRKQIIDDAIRRKRLIPAGDLQNFTEILLFDSS